MNLFRLEYEPSFELKDPTKYHLDYLASKKQQIEKAIDNHLAFVDPLGQSKHDNYFEKLQFLKDNTIKLMTDTSRCRMKGITQSYDMFDC